MYAGSMQALLELGQDCPQVVDFINHAIEELQEENVKINIHEGDDVQYPLSSEPHPCLGYFVALKGEQPQYGMAFSRDDMSWLPIAVHEYGHFLQWRHQRDFFESANFYEPGQKPTDVYELINDWSIGKRPLTRPQLVGYTHIARNLELDCERKTVDMIKQWNLPVNVDEYIQKSNAYVLEYHMIPIFGNTHLKSPYKQEAVWRQMPKSFNIDYDVEWHKYVELYWKHCFDPALSNA